MKKMFLICAIALTAAILPTVAQATCTVYGTVVAVEEWDNSYSGSTTHVTLKTGALTTYYYFFYTTDHNISNLAAIAMTSQTRVVARGDALSCPTGTGRYMGYSQYFDLR